MNRNQQPVRCLVFDAVGTLIRPLESISLVYQRFGQQHGIDLPQEQVKLRFSAARRQQFSESTDQPSSESIEYLRWKKVVADVFREHENPQVIFGDLWQHYADPKQWHLFDDVHSCLDRLMDEGVAISIASNFDRRLLAICNAIAPLDRISNVFCSSEVGFCKPDPRFFVSIEKQLRSQMLVDEASVLTMIGDDPVRDVRAAQAAGWNAVHLDRSVGEFRELIAAL